MTFFLNFTVLTKKRISMFQFSTGWISVPTIFVGRDFVHWQMLWRWTTLSLKFTSGATT